MCPSPRGTYWEVRNRMDATFWITLVLFAITYLALAVGKVPGRRMDRAGIALAGAAAMLGAQVLSLEQALSRECVNYEALLLLFGMMIVVGMLRLSGFFEQMTERAFARIGSPRQLLALTVGLAGVLSAFLVNDIICIALTPLVLGLCRRLGYDPLPHLMALATASNVGSAGAITGNPQNMIIGTRSGISYLRFAAKLFPVALLGLVVVYLLIAWIYRKRLTMPAPSEVEAVSQPQPVVAHRRLQLKTGAVTLAAIVLFFALPAGYLAVVALCAAAVLLVGRVSPEKIWRQVDWPLLVLFFGLFVVVYAFRLHVVSRWGVGEWSWLLARPVDLLSAASAVLSNLVSNVPAVLLFEPVLKAMPESSRETAWLALAMSSTFAGNLTVLGSVANLIVVEIARRDGVEVSFVEYCKAGVPLTLLTLGLGVAWLLFLPY